MSRPRQPEQRRSHKGGATPQHYADHIWAGQGQARSGHAHGTDKGAEGGGEGGGTPPDQRPRHP
jgi:hypothetical protein